MSKIKKVLAMVLALAMVLGMSVTTFAANENPTATITINGLIDESVVNYVRVVEPDTKSTIGWKFSNEAYAAEFKTAFNVGTDDAALEALMDIAEETINKNATAGTGHDSQELAKALDNLTQYATTPVSGEVIKDVEAGLYLVVASKEDYTYIPMMAYVHDQGSGDLLDATITAKVSTDMVAKKVAEDGQSVKKGDKVEYTVSTQYPFYPSSVKAEDATFEVKDILETATFEKDNNLTVMVGETPLTADNNDFTATISDDKKTLDIKFNYNHSLAGKDVEIKYTVTVGEVSSTVPMKNNVTRTTNTSASRSQVIVPSVKVVVIKTGDKGALLPNAEFTLYIKDDNSDITLTLADETTVKVREVEKKSTGTDGKVTFEGLDAQEEEYYVKETDAPKGYTLSNEVRKLQGATITEGTPVVTKETVDGKVIKVTTTEYTATDFEGQGYTFVDTKLSALPSTGGIGTTIFTIGGCLIMIVAAGLFFASRRKSAK